MEPWLAKLNAGEPEAAWDLFHERYRKLILATIRRLLPDHDDVMDVFSIVCEALASDNFTRLKKYAERSAGRASAATWLVVVVRNLTIDFLRSRDGRQRFSVPDTLAPLHQDIYQLVCLDGRSHVEAYEMLRAHHGLALAFPAFLREVRATHLAAPCPDRRPVRRPVRGISPDAPDSTTVDRTESRDLARRIAAAMSSQPADVRLAVNLFVVDGIPAADVARLVGWPDAKTVYNRVSRALKNLRSRLEAEGVHRDDVE